MSKITNGEEQEKKKSPGYKHELDQGLVLTSKSWQHLPVMLIQKKITFNQRCDYPYPEWSWRFRAKSESTEHQQTEQTHTRQSNTAVVQILLKIFLLSFLPPLQNPSTVLEPSNSRAHSSRENYYLSIMIHWKLAEHMNWILKHTHIYDDFVSLTATAYSIFQDL